jgi:serine/threonine-protein kinase
VEVPPAAAGPGATVAGFRLERLLGEGGMGRVYLARQLSMDRLVALKILPAAMAADAAIVERFVREVRLAARLDHPHLVTAYEAGQDGGVLFFAMAYIHGPTLHEWLVERDPMPEPQALGIALKIARALAYAWTEHRLLHRDIKPANILLDARGEPKLADLGLARTFDNAESGQTMPGAILGTPHFMSPEAAEGRPTDVRSDIYSLGATLWTMLTARAPFEGEPPAVVLRRQISEPYPDVRAWNPAVSAATLEILGRMLAKDPKRRFRSWEEVIAAMEAAGRPPLPVSSRPPIAALLAASVLLLLLLLLAWALVARRRRDSAPPPPPPETPMIPASARVRADPGHGPAPPAASGQAAKRRRDRDNTMPPDAVVEWTPDAPA